MQTTAEWIGDHLRINWFGIKARESDSGATWKDGKLVFHGSSESKRWQLPEKPTPERALELIARWQNG